jgi:P4 family phage/plasmid primase-like protien
MPDPRPDEFIEFIDALTESAPEGYEPWLFRCEQAGKNPDLSYGSWKADSARLSVPEAVEWMKGGGNVGIAATADGPLVNVDVDDDEETEIGDVKKTLLVRSRSRTGFHALYFEASDSDEIPNIPTDDAGEVRANWQYVVAPGSYVPVDDVDALPESERDMAGHYTVLEKRPPAEISYDELPQVFLDYDEAGGEMDVDPEEMPGGGDIEDFDGDEEGGYDDDDERESESALFDITARDVVLNEHGSVNIGDRWEAMFHGSETGANMSFSDKGLINCWRHGVAHNGLQALAVLSDYDGGCGDVGTGKKHSNAGSSCLTNEDGGHIWHAWKYAKENGYIPDDDPVPYSAMLHVARERSICPITDIPSGGDESLPAYAYDGVLESIRGHDNLDPGRKTTDEFGGDSGSSTTTAETDGGAATAQPTSDSGPSAGREADTDDDLDGWEQIRSQFRAAEDHDDRRTPRFESAMKIHRDGDFANIEESETLYVYDPDTGIYNQHGESRVRELLTQGLHEQFSATVKNEALEHIRGRNTLPHEEMGGPPWQIAAENCVIDLESNDNVEHDPDKRFMSQLGTDYDPEADAPRWEQFLDEVVPNEEGIKKLQEYAGYCLRHWDHPHHKVLFLVGPTSSGKSTFLDTINAMLGEGTTASLTPQEMTSERFAGAQLFDKWANIRNDIPKETVENTGKFKEIAAADPMKAEEKYEDPFRFEPTAKHLFAANQLPEAKLDDEAFYRRILLVPFPETVPEDKRDRHLDDKLQDELSGVLNWALEGLQRLTENGVFTGDRSPAQTENTWQKWGDSVKRFESAALMEADADHAIPRSKVYAAYLEYCRQNNIPTDTSNAMTRQLVKQGYEKDRAVVNGTQQRCFIGTKFIGKGKDLFEAAQKR